MIMKKLANFTISLLLTLVLSLSLIAADKKLPASDDSLYDQVRRKLANDPDVRGGAFEVAVKDGVVTIRGVVEKDKIKAKATKVTMKVKGVKSVDNQLRVSPTRT